MFRAELDAIDIRILKELQADGRMTNVELAARAGISAPIRRPRGRDIMAACGQLKSSSEKLSRAELDRRAEEKQAAL